MDEDDECESCEPWPDFLQNELPNILGYRLESDDSTGIMDTGQNLQDRTWELRDEVINFLPEIKLKAGAGAEDRDDNSVLFRAVSERDDNKVCIQYLWVFSHQIGTISKELLYIPWIITLLLLIFPITSTANGLTLLQNFIVNHVIWDASDVLDVSSAILFFVGLSAATILAGLIPHIRDYRTIQEARRFRFRISTIYLPIGFFTGYYILDMWGSWFVILGITLLVTVVYGAERIELLSSSHDMDYGPIFVWIERVDDTWTFKRAFWDSFHYNSDCWPRLEPKRKLLWDEADLKYLEIQQEKERNTRLKDQKRIRLSIDNPWRDFSPYTARFDITLTHLTRLAIIPAILSILVVFNVNPRTIFWTPSIVSMMIIFFLIMEATFDLSQEGVLNRWEKVKNDATLAKEFFDKHNLSHAKLWVLWNLKIEEARLKIITKMRDPFNPRYDYFKTFRDDEYTLLYERETMKAKLHRLEEEIERLKTEREE